MRSLVAHASRSGRDLGLPMSVSVALSPELHDDYDVDVYEEPQDEEGRVQAPLQHLPRPPPARGRAMPQLDFSTVFRDHTPRLPEPPVKVPEGVENPFGSLPPNSFPRRRPASHRIVQNPATSSFAVPTVQRRPATARALPHRAHHTQRHEHVQPPFDNDTTVLSSQIALRQRPNTARTLRPQAEGQGVSVCEQSRSVARRPVEQTEQTRLKTARVSRT